jgi:hypothetical protein
LSSVDCRLQADTTEDYENRAATASFNSDDSERDGGFKVNRLNRDLLTDFGLPLKSISEVNELERKLEDEEHLNNMVRAY